MLFGLVPKSEDISTVFKNILVIPGSIMQADVYICRQHYHKVDGCDGQGIGSYIYSRIRYI